MSDSNDIDTDDMDIEYGSEIDNSSSNVDYSSNNEMTDNDMYPSDWGSECSDISPDSSDIRFDNDDYEPCHVHIIKPESSEPETPSDRLYDKQDYSYDSDFEFDSYSNTIYDDQDYSYYADADVEFDSDNPDIEVFYPKWDYRYDPDDEKCAEEDS